MATDTSGTGRDSDKFMLRMPDGMRDRLKEAAKANNRTMNAEIVARLQATFDETIVTTVEARATPVGTEQFEFNADAIADKVMERLEGKASSHPNRVIIVGNLGRDPSERVLPSEYLQYYQEVMGGQPLAELKPRGNEPYGPAKSPNARRTKKN